MLDEYNQYNRPIPSDCHVVERNGHAFLVNNNPSVRFRYDPITLAIVAAGAGTAIKVKGTLEQGKQAQKIAKQRAAVDIANAEAVRERAVEEAKIRAKKGQRLRAGQKSAAATGNIRINIGSPLPKQNGVKNKNKIKIIFFMRKFQNLVSLLGFLRLLVNRLL